MAKKKIISTPTPERIDPWADAVRDLRSKGFDDNRIAAMLMINVNKVKDIK